MTTAEFIAANKNGDIRRLALQAQRWPEVDMPFALDQIAGWQKARTKLPAWAATEGIVFPPRLSMEQCSSELTARYKAAVVNRLFSDCQPRSMADLTGGFGVDFSYIAQVFLNATYVERNQQLCAISSSNFERLGLHHATTVCAQAEDYLAEMSPVSLLFLDPARRDEHGGRTVAIADCTPDVAALWSQLLAKADIVMLKLSPMLDIDKALRDLGFGVLEVHVVAAQGECKELLLVGRRDFAGTPRLHCVRLQSPDETAVFSTSYPCCPTAPLLDTDLAACVGRTLCEPDATIMKAGCFGDVAERFSLRAIAPNSHLFVAEEPAEAFPGRQFRVKAVTTMNRRELRAALSGCDRANIAVRNFPLTADALRAKLRLKDGGQTYLFATTDRAGRHLLLITEKFL